MSWEQEAERLRFENGLSWSALAQEMAGYFPALSPAQVREKVRDHIRGTERYKEPVKPVGVFSDMHAPFDHPNFPYFLQDTFKKFGVGRVVCLGDMMDSHAVSNHAIEPCALGAYSELDLAVQHMKVYATLFPEVQYITGNHDLRPERMAASVGMGSRYIKSVQELLELPDGWVCRGDEFIMDDVLYTHGINCGGKDGALNKALSERMSVCIGHSHAFGGVKQNANKRDSVFGMNVGCGVNPEAYAFAYGKHSRNRETLGCGIVFNSEYAVFVPMGREYM